VAFGIGVIAMVAFTLLLVTLIGRLANGQMQDARGDDDITIELTVDDAAATDVRKGGRQAAREFDRRYFVQMKGTARISGRIGGRKLSGAGQGFFETYR